MRKLVPILLSILVLAAASGCVYRQTISQGNVVKQEDLDRIEIGMTKGQIRFLLGTPMIDDPFHRDRWDYVYYLKIGRGEAGQKRWVSIHFQEELVVDIRKDQELSPDL